MHEEKAVAKGLRESEDTDKVIIYYYTIPKDQHQGEKVSTKGQAKPPGQTC